MLDNNLGLGEGYVTFLGIALPERECHLKKKGVAPGLNSETREISSKRLCLQP